MCCQRRGSNYALSSVSDSDSCADSSHVASAVESWLRSDLELSPDHHLSCLTLPPDHTHTHTPFSVRQQGLPLLSSPLLSAPLLSSPLLSSHLISSHLISSPLLSSPLLYCQILFSPLLSSPLLSLVTRQLFDAPTFFPKNAVVNAVVGINLKSMSALNYQRHIRRKPF